MPNHIEDLRKFVKVQQKHHFYCVLCALTRDIIAEHLEVESVVGFANFLNVLQPCLLVLFK